MSQPLKQDAMSTLSVDAKQTSVPNKRARYIVIEGIDGVGKTTQCARLAEHLRSKGYQVLETREPGTSHLPITLELRKFMLDKQYDQQLNRISREYISQSIRAIHLEHLIKDALTQYDFIIQDRGLMSGMAYGYACGNSLQTLISLTEMTCDNTVGDFGKLYSDVIFLDMNEIDAAARLEQRNKISGKEFIAGDVIEQRGASFMSQVRKTMYAVSALFPTVRVEIAAHDSQDHVLELILHKLAL